MTRKDAIKLMKTQREVIAINEGAYLLFLALGLSLLYKGVYPIAKVTKGY